MSAIRISPLSYKSTYPEDVYGCCTIAGENCVLLIFVISNIFATAFTPSKSVCFLIYSSPLFGYKKRAWIFFNFHAHAWRFPIYESSSHVPFDFYLIYIYKFATENCVYRNCTKYRFLPQKWRKPRQNRGFLRQYLFYRRLMVEVTGLEALPQNANSRFKPFCHHSASRPYSVPEPDPTPKVTFISAPRYKPK